MCRVSKPISMTDGPYPARGLVWALALALLAASPAGAAEGFAAFPWQRGLIETSRYNIERQGRRVGEIEQIVYGVEDDTGRRRYRVVVELIRRTNAEGGPPLIGRVTSEVFFDLDSMGFQERRDNFAKGDTEGRVLTLRTPSGLTTSSESMSGGISRPDTETSMELPGDDLYIDLLALSFFVRTVPMNEGHVFDVTTVIPLEKILDRLRGQVGPLQRISWHDQSIEVRRVEVGSRRGTGSYYVRTDPSHQVVRFVSHQQENYELQPSTEDTPGPR